MRWVWTSIIAITPWLVGCQSSLPREVWELPSYQSALAEARSPDFKKLHYRVAVAPREQAYEAGFLEDDDPVLEILSEDVDPENVYKLPLTDGDDSDLQRDLVAVLKDLEIFDDVSSFSGARGLLGPDLIPEAAAGEFDFLLVPKVTRNIVVYRGANDVWWWPGLFAWIFAWFPTYFVPDETFQAKTEVEVTVYHVRSGSVTFQARYEGDSEASLSDVDMGFIASSLWSAVSVRIWGRAWGVLGAGNFENVAQILTKPAVSVAIGKFAEQFTREYPGALSNELTVSEMQAAPVQKYAIVVGVDRYAQAEIAPATYAEEDARALYAFLKNAAGFKESQLELLVGPAATKEAIEKAILRRRNSLKNDLVLIYFRGQTALDYAAESSGVLAHFLPYDADLARLSSTGFPLGSADGAANGPGLADWLNLVGSERLVVIFDSALGLPSALSPEFRLGCDQNADGQVSAEELSQMIKNAAPTEVYKSIFEAVSKSKPRSILTASAWNEPLMLFSAESRGAYNYHFVWGGEGRPGVPAGLSGLHQHVSDIVSKQARYISQSQRPQTLGSARLIEGISLKD